MKYFILATTLLFSSSSALAYEPLGQTNEYIVCKQTNYKEVYQPGFYDEEGNYTPGYVTTQEYKVPCTNTLSQNQFYGQNEYRPEQTYQQRPQQRYQNRPVNRPVNRPRLNCDATSTVLGGVLGGGIAASMSRGDGYKWSVPLGAFLGGAALGCRTNSY